MFLWVVFMVSFHDADFLPLLHQALVYPPLPPDQSVHQKWWVESHSPGAQWWHLAECCRSHSLLDCSEVMDDSVILYCLHCPVRNDYKWNRNIKPGYDWTLKYNEIWKGFIFNCEIPDLKPLTFLIDCRCPWWPKEIECL